jgi:hypothetical protein
MWITEALVSTDDPPMRRRLGGADRAAAPMRATRHRPAGTAEPVRGTVSTTDHRIRRPIPRRRIVCAAPLRRRGSCGTRIGWGLAPRGPGHAHLGNTQLGDAPSVGEELTHVRREQVCGHHDGLRTVSYKAVQWSKRHTTDWTTATVNHRPPPVAVAFLVAMINLACRLIEGARPPRGPRPVDCAC